MALRADGLGKRFRRRSESPRLDTWKRLLTGAPQPVDQDAYWALRNVSLAVAPGEILGVIGQNGSGKSTLLRLLAHLMQPDEGSVEHRGRLCGLLELNAGAHPDLSGRENILINGVVAGMTREEVNQQLRDIVAFSELEEFIDSPLRTYSTGMIMRLGFSVAVHADPDILLIDEVLAVGDLAFQQKCIARILNFKRRGCAIILISHDLSQVSSLCDRVLWLSHGEVAGVGEPAEIIANYKSHMASETRRRTPIGISAEGASASSNLRLHENRIGSLEAEIVSVRLLNEDAIEIDTLESGSSLLVEVRLIPHADLSSPVLSVSLSNTQDETCLDVNTDADRAILPALEQPYSVILRLTRLDLSPGAYRVSVGVYRADWQYAYDYHDGAYQLLMTADRPSRGVLSPPRQWTVKQTG